MASWLVAKLPGGEMTGYLMHRPQTPQPGFGSITLFQNFKILNPRLRKVES